MATVALAEGQLDLFADLDAAATAAAAAEAQRRFDEAPSMFGEQRAGLLRPHRRRRGMVRRARPLRLPAPFARLARRDRRRPR